MFVDGGRYRKDLYSEHQEGLDLRSWVTLRRELSCLTQEQKVYMAV